jgi:hypothetical protein
MDEKENLLRASIEKLAAEKRRRIEEKIEKGLAVRRGPIVVGVPDPEVDYSAVYMDDKGREVYPPEDCAVIVTGVPRAGPDDQALANLLKYGIESPHRQAPLTRGCSSAQDETE